MSTKETLEQGKTLLSRASSGPWNWEKPEDREAIEWCRQHGQDMINALFMLMKNKDDIILGLRSATHAGDIGIMTYDRIKSELIRALEWE